MADYGERVGHQPITMKRVDSYDDLKNGPAGLFFWRESHDADTKDGIRYIGMTLPTKANEKGWCYCSIPVKCAPKIEQAWEWNGDEEKPTLTPSIGHFNHWHGWVRDGKMIEA